MIYERSIFVFAWIILSSLVASGGSTTESKNLQRSFVAEREIILSSANPIRAQDEILTNGYAQREVALRGSDADKYMRTSPLFLPLSKLRKKAPSFYKSASPEREGWRGCLGGHSLASRCGQVLSADAGFLRFLAIPALDSRFKRGNPANALRCGQVLSRNRSFGVSPGVYDGRGGVRVTREGVHLSDGEWMTEYGQAAPVLNEQKILYLSSTKPILTVQDHSKIEQRLAVVGIGVTSILFLILLWFLFKPEPKNTPAKVTSLDKQDSLDRSNKIDNSYEVVDESELAAIKLLSSAKINLAQESPNSTALEKALKVRENQKTSFDIDIIQPDQDSAKDRASVEVNSDTPGMVRIVAGNTTEIDIVLELIKDLQQSDRTLRRKAIWELAQKGDSRAIEPLVEIMSEATSLGKSLILSAITQIAHRNFAPVNNILFASLEDKNSEVRKDAIRNLVALYESISGVNKRLTNMLDDSDREVRQTAKWALKRIDLEPSIISQTCNITNEDSNHDIASSNGTSSHN